MTPQSERIEVPGARPALFRLKEWAPDSFRLFQSSRKIGQAVVERGAWRAEFRFRDKDWTAQAETPGALLRLVGTFILAHEARDAAAAPVDQGPAKKKKGRASEDERLSLELLKRAQELRTARLDALIGECRKRISPA